MAQTAVRIFGTPVITPTTVVMGDPSIHWSSCGLQTYVFACELRRQLITQCSRDNQHMYRCASTYRHFIEELNHLFQLVLGLDRHVSFLDAYGTFVLEQGEQPDIPFVAELASPWCTIVTKWGAESRKLAENIGGRVVDAISKVHNPHQYAYIGEMVKLALPTVIGK